MFAEHRPNFLLRSPNFVRPRPNLARGRLKFARGRPNFARHSKMFGRRSRKFYFLLFFEFFFSMALSRERTKTLSSVINSETSSNSR